MMDFLFFVFIDGTAQYGTFNTQHRNTAAAAGYWVWNLRAGLEQETGSWRFREFARLDNLANRSYVGSVIVNESNARYFEAAPGRLVPERNR
jgi:iron complex outermembrane receptor protein